VTLSDTKSGKFHENGITIIYVNRLIVRPLRILKTLITIIRCLPSNEILLCNGLFFESAVAMKFHPIRSVAKVVGDLAWERYKNRGGKLSIEDFNDQRLKSFDRAIFSWSLSQFDAIYTPGQALSEIVNSWKLSLQATVIENGVECARINLNESATNYDVVTVTRLVPWKNVDILIRACKIAGCNLVVVGDGPEMRNLKRLAIDLGVDVTFTGQIEKGMVREVLNQSKIFALISSYEGQSFALTEAMMTGKAILVSEIPGNLAVVQNMKTGLTSPIEATEIASKIALLLANRGLASSLGENAKSRAEANYCKDRQFEKTLQLLEGKP
jgi:glycosyltransferase involved in cell wall biosynthesis